MIRRTCCLILAIVSLATAVPSSVVAQTPAPATQSAYESTPLFSDDRKPSRAVRSSVTTRPVPATPSSVGVDIGRLVLALAVVLGLIGGLYWLMRRYYGGSVSSASTRAVKVLSRTPLAPRQQVLLLQVGRRVVVVGDSGGAMATLAQIEDPDEVAQLLGQLQTEQMQRAASFGSVFRRNQKSFDENEALGQPATLSDAMAEHEPGHPDDPAAPVSDELAQQRSEVAGLLEKVRSLKNQINR